MQKLQVLMVFVCTLLVCTNQELSASVESNLKKIPYEERFFLKSFFKDFFLHDSLGHVLFFDTKPASITAFSLERNRHFFEKLFAKGWACWKKYEYLFPHPNFIFAEDEMFIH